MDNKKETISTKKVSWNAAEGIIQEISNRRSMANTFFINGNMIKAFNTLIAIKQSVVQSFETNERQDLEEIEKKFNKISGYLHLGALNSFNPKIIEAHKLSMRIARELYPKYNDKLMDLLQVRGYLVGEMADASRMKF